MLPTVWADLRKCRTAEYVPACISPGMRLVFSKKARDQARLSSVAIPVESVHQQQTLGLLESKRVDIADYRAGQEEFLALGQPEFGLPASRCLWCRCRHSACPRPARQRPAPAGDTMRSPSCRSDCNVDPTTLPPATVRLRVRVVLHLVAEGIIRH